MDRVGTKKSWKEKAVGMNQEWRKYSNDSVETRTLKWKTKAANNAQRSELIVFSETAVSSKTE